MTAFMTKFWVVCQTNLCFIKSYFTVRTLPIMIMNRIIEDIEPNFDLIMITEYLLESLILLKYDLCLTLGKASYYAYIFYVIIVFFR